jgi:hypothetical protein
LIADTDLSFDLSALGKGSDLLMVEHLSITSRLEDEPIC